MYKRQAFIGAFAFPLLSLLGWLMTRLPQPTEEDKKLRTERVTLNRGRRHLFGGQDTGNDRRLSGFLFGYGRGFRRGDWQQDVYKRQV